MKFCACLTICLSLPFVLFAEDEGEAKAESAPDENAEAAETVTDPGFERFKTVLVRMPFGQPPPGFNPDAPGGAMAGMTPPKRLRRRLRRPRPARSSSRSSRPCGSPC